jgi:hypothetical protein
MRFFLAAFLTILHAAASRADDLPTPLTLRTLRYPGALVAAAYRGRLRTVETLLAQGADPNETDRGQTALAVAVERRHLESALRLVAAGADLNRGDPVCIAERQAALDFVVLLRVSGATADCGTQGR